jgi:ubiquinol-cytochrome c reductase iron-sulfur subunit
VQASKDVLAMASLEVDLTKIDPGQTITVKWRGKPVFIKRRTEEDIELANSVDLKELRDPQADSDRVQNPEVRALSCKLSSHNPWHLSLWSIWSLLCIQ